LRFTNCNFHIKTPGNLTLFNFLKLFFAMNTENTATPPEAIPAPNIQAVDFSSEAKQIHRKIAKLPKPLRDLINSSLDDGLPAHEIIQKLQASTNPPLPYPISEANISRWKNTGYLRYLAHQEHLDYVDANREAALEMVATSDNMTLPEATLQIIASQYFETLGDFSPAAMKQKLAEDPLKYTRFLNVFARLVREMVHLNKYRDAKAKALAEANKLDPDRDLSESETLAWGGRLDRAFHRKDPRRIKTHKPAPDTSRPEEAPIKSEISAATITPASATAKPDAAQRDPDVSVSPVALDSPATDYSLLTTDSHSIENPPVPAASASQILEEHCLDCHHPLPPLTPEGKRPFERCQVCDIILPPPGTCTRPSADKCHHCGATLPRRLPDGRRPKPTCHNCGTSLGRELDEDIKKYTEE
jgi:hypothetical protein